MTSPPGLALVVLLLLAPPARADDPADVRAAFERYRAAAEARDGAAAVALVTPASQAYYQRLRDLALNAPRAEVAALPMADRLMVFRLRHEFTTAELAPLTGADLIATSIAEAWSSPKALQPIAIASVELAGDGAIALPTRAGEPVPLRLVFCPAAGAWQLDLQELARGADAALEATLQLRAKRARVDLDTAMRWAIEDTSGQLVDKDLWLPLADGRR
jgi:hypothetical protein